MTIKDIDDVQIEQLLHAINKKYGYDFRQYSRAHIKRRILNRMVLSGLESDELQEKILDSEPFAAQLLQDLSITVTEMFRDPGFYRSVRENVIPLLKTYSFIKIWHAGCSTGEEAYSMAILLKEEGLYERTTMYATDFNQHAIDTARQGIFPLEAMKHYGANYQKSGGLSAFSDYYTADDKMAIMDQSLKNNIVWANHNLVTDHVFAEVNMVFCRNVLIYFDKELQNRVQSLFFNSLMHGGILCLGVKESLAFCDYTDKYRPLDKENRIFRKKY
jgi:chemotaxis protein methyltransferase CheR